MATGRGNEERNQRTGTGSGKVEEMYRVEYFNTELNCWVKSSTHKNEDSATVNMEVLAQTKKARVIHEGRIILKGGK